MSEGEEFEGISDATAEPAQSAGYAMRVHLIGQIAAVLKELGWSHAGTGRRCGMTAYRAGKLKRGMTAVFSLDALVNIAAALGRPVRVEVDVAEEEG